MMNITEIETQYQNYAASGTSRTKSSSSEGTFDSFQKEIVNWQKRIKEAIDKEQENDSNGSILMSEKQWRNLMKKVDNAIDTSKDNKKEQEQEEKKQLEERNLIRKDTVAASFQTNKANLQFFGPKLVQTSCYTAFHPESRKRD
ncbi:hypothetical protein [Propionispora vibrioides]|uniref:Uncharacterized protein n=1 Tax=Propionispora vibrioides TaxID=112903 RepID=A0A1H8XPV3_9FIRM|nr:hypothetical protein [Propionispora vibrioides]SEP41925.1 hypothetical protein SAMN04490178_12726 [Propionispora vibrioides]